ncbi:Fic family protein [Pedobacter cryoconitis]|uniref:Fic family protein n=1 Tax=Pedobacter cryoconitis TaxID=188932 RepID=A0A127VGN4_9SPHI|nr:Fic family protein [Pedobacter cryoconitis]AMQ00486.1 Fic family protein [Pedobacter cryoconitis]
MSYSLTKVDDLTAQLRSLASISTENLKKLNKKFRMEFNYNSNHMEGNTLSYGETELLLMFDDTKGNHQFREYEEMKAHDVAYQMIETWASATERPLTEQNVKELNRIILIRPFWKEEQTADGQETRREIKVGNYKAYPNSVCLSNGELFEYASPTDTPILMHELMDWYRTEEDGLHPITLAAMFHYKFVRIHPFDDGNGRIARLLMNYVLLRNGLPPVIIKSEDKAGYLRALHFADIGDYEPFIAYIADQAVWSLGISIKAAKGEDIEETSDLQKEIALLNRRLTVENKPSKHPIAVYEVFKWFSKEVWPAIQESLEQFDSLFAEKKSYYYTNQVEETYEKKNILESPLLRSTAPPKVKIFGLDIYKEEVCQIDWKTILYGIKGASANPEIEIKAVIEFKTAHYELNIKLDNNTISNTSYHYNDRMLKSDIQKLQTSLTKQILEEIKARIQ